MLLQYMNNYFNSIYYSIWHQYMCQQNVMFKYPSKWWKKKKTLNKDFEIFPTIWSESYMNFNFDEEDLVRSFINKKKTTNIQNNICLWININFFSQEITL